MRASLVPFLRRARVLATLALTVSALSPAAEASTQGEQFIANNVQQGLSLLNDRSLSEAQRRDQFSHFVINLTDMKRIAVFTLGQYRRGASQADLDQFSNAFQDYAVAAYQSYFGRYSGQTLKVVGSVPGSSSTNEVVRTVLVDTTDHSGQQPPEIDFRVYFDRGTPAVLDFSYAGIWLAETERNDFDGFLGQNGGNIHALVDHLGVLVRQMRAGQVAKQGS